MAIKYPYEYDKEKRKRAKIYTRTKIINGIVNSIFISMIFLVFLLYSGYTQTILEYAIQIAGSYYVPAYIIVLMTLLTIVEFPLSFYSGFIYEHKYKLSNQCLYAWLVDFFKEIALMYAIAVPLLWGLYVLMGWTPIWYVYAAILYIGFTAFLDYIYPIVIFPIFYKTRPYADEEMKRKLLLMAEKAGIKNFRSVEVACESEKSNKANAMFTGIGGSKRIVLFDTLLDNFTADEIETVVAHELGHYVNKDILRLTVIDSLKIIPVFLIIIAVFENYAIDFGISGIGDISGLPLFLLVNSVIELILMGPMMAYSRKREKAADLFALEFTGKAEAQISTEKRLADMNLADESPHALVEFLLYSHPAVSKRIEYAREWEKKKKKE
ncbi:MAG: M48 family metallopeptidase [archaeon]